jgi:hypothetical protein
VQLFVWGFGLGFVLFTSRRVWSTVQRQGLYTELGGVRIIK